MDEEHDMTVNTPKTPGIIGAFSNERFPSRIPPNSLIQSHKIAELQEENARLRAVNEELQAFVDARSGDNAPLTAADIVESLPQPFKDSLNSNPRTHAQAVRHASDLLKLPRKEALAKAVQHYIEACMGKLSFDPYFDTIRSP